MNVIDKVVSGQLIEYQTARGMKRKKATVGKRNGSDLSVKDKNSNNTVNLCIAADYVHVVCGKCGANIPVAKGT